MGVVVHPERLDTDELRRFMFISVSTPEGCRLRGVMCGEWFRRSGIINGRRARWGRWPILVWFTQQERILSQDELAEALARHHATGGD